jgi:hypothetical protein
LEKLSVTVNSKGISNEDLKYIIEPLRGFDLKIDNSDLAISISSRLPMGRKASQPERGPYLAALTTGQLVQTIGILIGPYAVPVLVDIGKIILDKVLQRTVRVFSKYNGQHFFYMEWQVVEPKVNFKVLIKTSDIKVFQKARRDIFKKFDQALQIITDPSFPSKNVTDTVLIVDVKKNKFKFLRERNVNLEIYDENSGKWKQVKKRR